MADSCGACGHFPHPEGVCFNMASDGDCNCKGGRLKSQLQNDLILGVITGALMQNTSLFTVTGTDVESLPDGTIDYVDIEMSTGVFRIRADYLGDSALQQNRRALEIAAAEVHRGEA